MIGIYLSGAVVIAVSLFFSKAKTLVYTLLGIFLILQCWFTIHSWLNFGNTEMVYFTFDSLGFLMLATLTIVAIPAAIHSGIYIENHRENTRELYSE